LEDEKELNIRLNANTGAWDFDLLANNFDLEDLTTWGLEIKDIEADIEDDKESLDTLDTNSIKCPHCNKEFLLND